MVTLVIVKNPFSPQDGREIKCIEANGTLADLLEEHKILGVDLLATINGYSVDNTTKIHDGDFVVLYPAIEKGGKGGGGKGILGIVAAVALTVVSFGIGGLVGAGAWGASVASWGVMGYVAAAAVMFIGSSLIGRGMSGQSVDLGSYDNGVNSPSGDDSSPTYSWGGVQTMEGQNNAIALTYGKVKSGGQTIGKFVSVRGENEYLNWLVAAGEGPVTITDVKLNNNSVSMYSGVSYQTRNGELNQSVIDYFGDTYFTKNLSYHLTNDKDWHTTSVEGTATEGIIFKLEAPNGILSLNDNGTFGWNSVHIHLQYRQVGGGWVDANSDFVFSDCSRTAQRKEFRINHLPRGEYEARCRFISADNESREKATFDVYWTAVTSVIYDDFTYPCTALLGIRAKATNQLNGTPTLTFMKERSTVWVWNGSAYVEKPANNPAWACYDILHQARKLGNNYEVRGVSKESIRYDDFAAWAAFCATKQYYVNIELNASGELLEIINNKIAPIGHGLVVRFGTRFGCIYDHVQAPVQMFGMGNIVEGTFQEEFLKVSDRANCVEITFTNKDADYERDVLTIYGDTFDADGYAKTAQMTFDGIVDYKQAYREGMYQLYSNKYLLRTVSFEADIDSIACTVGDVVLVSHDVPKWANSGRIDKINGATWTLPVELEDTSSSYHIQWRTVKDALYSRSCEIVSSADGWTVVNVQGEIPVADPPHEGDVFDIALANIDSKPFVIKSITRAQDFRRKISCIEYNGNIYEENYDIPDIDYTRRYGEPKNVTNLACSITQNRNAYGELVATMRCSWDVPDNGGAFTVMLMADNEEETWDIWESNIKGNSCEFNVTPATIYYVKVVTSIGIEQSTGTQVGPITPLGDGALPRITGLNGAVRYRNSKDGEPSYEIYLSWNVPLFLNYKDCMVYYKKNNRQVKDLSMTDAQVSSAGFENEWELAGRGYENFTLSDVTAKDIYKFAIVTTDAYGNVNDPDYSPSITINVYEKTEKPDTPDGFGINIDGTNDIITVYWNKVSNLDIQYYEIRNDVNCGVEDNHLIARTSGNSYVVQLQNRTGTLYLFAYSAIGKYGYPANLTYNKPIPEAPSNITLTSKLGGFAIEVAPVPVGCDGVNIYINGSGETPTNLKVRSLNGTYTHSCGAGIYVVTAAYTDLFGEGTRSPSSSITVKALVDSTLLDAQAVTKEKLSTSLQSTVDAVATNTSDISALATRMNTAELGIDTNTSTITALAQDVSDDETNIAALQVQANNISSTVFDNQGASRVDQNANGISAIVTNLGDSTLAGQNYAAIKVMQQGILSKVSATDLTKDNGILESYLSQDATGFQIKGDLIHITGQTLIDGNVITNGMIQAGAVTADKISLGTGVGTARMTLETNLLSVYDEDGHLRVRIGVWDEN